MKQLDEIKERDYEKTKGSHFMPQANGRPLKELFCQRSNARGWILAMLISQFLNLTNKVNEELQNFDPSNETKGSDCPFWFHTMCQNSTATGLNHFYMQMS